MHRQNKNISCIIPAYNEEKTITGVVKVCLKVPQIKEIIVVDDGSHDQTPKKLQSLKHKIKIISYSQNQGKGYAVTQGIKTACYPYLLFLDADLINLKPHHIYSLIQPILKNQADMTIAALVSPNNPYYRSWPFSGQRCLKKKDLITLLGKIEKTRYGLEVFLNEKFREKRVIVVPLVSSSPLHLVKPSKQKDWVTAYIKEVWDIFLQTLSIRKSSYRKKIKIEFAHDLASYLKINYRRIKDYLLEDLEE